MFTVDNTYFFFSKYIFFRDLYMFISFLKHVFMIIFIIYFVNRKSNKLVWFLEMDTIEEDIKGGRGKV